MNTVKTVLTLFCAVLVTTALVPSLSGPLESPCSRFIVSLTRTPENMAKLRPLELDILMVWEGKIYLTASAEDLFKLQEANITFFDETGHFPDPASDKRDVFALTSRNGPYHSYAELERDLFALEQAYPNLAKVYDIGDSHEMRNIYALKISDNVQLEEESEAEVCITGCHHAREWISVEVPFYVAQHLLDSYATDAYIRSLVNQSEVWIVPLVNPDGL